MTPEELAEVVRVRRMCTTGEAARIRHKAKVTLREMAGALGVSAGGLQKWEVGQRAPEPELALRYGRLLELIRAASARRGSS